VALITTSECCDVSANGITFHRQPTAEEWQQLGDAIATTQKGLMWIVGDWLLAGESGGYIERGKHREACERFGIAYQTAAQAVRVCRAFPECCMRIQHLTFNHHQLVANREDAVELLEWAAEKKATVKELREEKRNASPDSCSQTSATRQEENAPTISFRDIVKKTEGKSLNELALFAGAGGGILGGHLLGWRTICAVEQNEYAASVLMQRQNDGCLRPFPVWDDVQTFDGTPWRGCVDVVSGGFPCQDISINGNGEGISGQRSGLWAHMARIISEVRPQFVYVENSPALTTRGLGQVLGDLAKMGFDAQWGCMGAADIGGHHERKRIWIVANSPMSRREEDVPLGNGKKVALSSRIGDVPRVRNWGRDKPGLDRVADGMANRVDRINAIGNGQVPGVAAAAFRILSEG
jgi:DNA (cytosine-5)-methyltransferase 1